MQLIKKQSSTQFKEDLLYIKWIHYFFLLSLKYYFNYDVLWLKRIDYP